MRHIYNSIFQLKPYTTQNIKHAIKQNVFIPGCTCTTSECVIQKNSSGFAFNSSWLTPNIELHVYYIIEKMPSDGEIHLFMSYSGGFPLKFCFCNGPYMIACFHEHLARVMKIGTLCEKILQISNMTVKLISEQFLTMNL